MPPQTKHEVIVIGAGVIGLQTALTLLEAGYGVTIVAKYWPGDVSLEYTSPWAGAHWRSHAGPREVKLQQYDRETYEHWTALLKSGEKETGLALLPVTFYWDHPDPETASNCASLWWKDVVDDFRIIPQSSLPPETDFGAKYASYCINPGIYLSYLLGKLGDLGVKTVTAEIDSLGDVWELPGVADDGDGDGVGAVGVVNCTGMGARGIVPDSEVYPVKGQTVLVKRQTENGEEVGGAATGMVECKFRQGRDYISYVIHRPGSGSGSGMRDSGGTTILGGIKEADDWTTDVDPCASQTILTRCAKLAPELLNANGGFDVISEQVGRRPARKGGPRVELEALGEGGKFVCHNYGHAGAGYQNSVGAAREVLGLINGLLKVKG